jgi:hypothetical protein
MLQTATFSPFSGQKKEEIYVSDLPFYVFLLVVGDISSL